MTLETYRVYFNCREDAPNVWSWDRGEGTEEHIVAGVMLINTSGEFKFDATKRLPLPSAWLEVQGMISDCGGGEVRIYGVLFD